MCLRRDLIDRHAEVRLRAALGHRAGEEHRGRAGVVGAGRHVGAARSGHVRVRQAADDVDVLAERLERLEDLGEREARALGRRRPLVHRGAVRHVEAGEARLRAAPPSAAAASAPAPSRRGTAARHRARYPCRNVRRDRCFLKMNIAMRPPLRTGSSSASGTAASAPRRAPATRSGSRSVRVAPHDGAHGRHVFGPHRPARRRRSAASRPSP